MDKLYILRWANVESAHLVGICRLFGATALTPLEYNTGIVIALLTQIFHSGQMSSVIAERSKSANIAVYDKISISESLIKFHTYQIQDHLTWCIK